MTDMQFQGLGMLSLPRSRRVCYSKRTKRQFRDCMTTESARLARIPRNRDAGIPANRAEITPRNRACRASAFSRLNFASGHNDPPVN